MRPNPRVEVETVNPRIAGGAGVEGVVSAHNRPRNGSGGKHPGVFEGGTRKLPQRNEPAEAGLKSVGGLTRFAFYGLPGPSKSHDSQ